ncbi:MAG: hypothetical protein PHX58_13665 [Desulfovibrio sp.]|jgi:hypothetical protein|nr:hypothetical protein [Desulfovibrio sp.]
MNIGSIDRLSLENLAPHKLQEARSNKVQLPEAAQAAPMDTVENGIGLNLEGLDKIHSLDPDRVASLIADPFGDE